MSASKGARRTILTLGMTAGFLFLRATAGWAGQSETKTQRTPYDRRVAKFSAVISKEPTRSARIKKAIAIAENRKSEYRTDAINFLAEVRAREAVPSLILLSHDPDLRGFAIYALGESPSEKSIPVLIDYLSDSNENFRGNAFRALTKVTRVSFNFDYSASEPERKSDVEEIWNWWKKNKATFKVQEETPDEKRQAEEAWQRYGKQYIGDLSR